MKKLYFVRHGLSEMNRLGMRAGQIETPLTEKGRRQAKEAGRFVKQYGIDYIICSPLGRAYETACIIAKEIRYPVDQIEQNSLLLERSFGPLEGQPWSPDVNLDGFADVETFDSVAARARMALDHIRQLPASTILIVGHSTFGRALLHVLHPDEPTIASGHLKNAEVIRLE